MLTFLFYVCSSFIANYLGQTLNLTLFSSELETVLLRWEIVLQQRIPGACTGKKYKFPSALNSYFFSSVALQFCHSLFIQRYKSRFRFHCNKELIWFARLQRPTEWLTEESESGTGHFTVSNPRCRSLESAGKRMSSVAPASGHQKVKTIQSLELFSSRGYVSAPIYSSSQTIVKSTTEVSESIAA